MLAADTPAPDDAGMAAVEVASSEPVTDGTSGAEGEPPASPGRRQSRSPAPGLTPTETETEAPAHTAAAAAAGVDTMESSAAAAAATPAEASPAPVQPVPSDTGEPDAPDDSNGSATVPASATPSAPPSSSSSLLSVAFDPVRSSTPASNPSSPLQQMLLLDASDREPAGSAPGGASDASAGSLAAMAAGEITFQRHSSLPILSLPALPGQRVCACMRAVEEAPHLHANVPTSPNTLFAPLASPTTPGLIGASPSPGAFTPVPSSPLVSTPAVGTGGAGSMERLLGLQDRFWLSTGELALHNEECAVERGVDGMEALAVQLAHQAQALSHTLRALRDAQLQGVQSVLHQLEQTNGELVEALRTTRGEESMLRERIETLSAQVDKHRQTVRMGAHLALASSKQAREAAHLEAARAARDAGVRQLERSVSQRTLVQAQMLNVGTLAAECRQQDVSKRDYKGMYLQAQHALFRRSCGATYQQQMLTLIKVLSRLRDTGVEVARRKRLVEHTIHELRARISLVVSAYWK